MNVGIQSSGTYWLPVLHIVVSASQMTEPSHQTASQSPSVSQGSYGVKELHLSREPLWEFRLQMRGSACKQWRCHSQAVSVFPLGLHSPYPPPAWWPVWLWLGNGELWCYRQWVMGNHRCMKGPWLKWQGQVKVVASLKWYCANQKGMPPRLCGLKLADEWEETVNAAFPWDTLMRFPCASPLRVKFSRAVCNHVTEFCLLTEMRTCRDVSVTTPNVKS